MRASAIAPGSGMTTEMTDSVWLGVLLGAGILGVYVGARLLTHRLSVRAYDHRTFLWVEIGGLLARMSFVFGAVALVLLFLEVHEIAFVSTVIVLLVASMGVETRLIIRKMDRGSLGP